jgi:hypothetical protein
MSPDPRGIGEKNKQILTYSFPTFVRSPVDAAVERLRAISACK